MKCKSSFRVAALLLGSCSLALAQAEAPQTPIRILHNSDVLRMHKEGLKPGAIVAKIVTSNCAFDIFPPVLRDLKRRGVPDTVLVAMAMVPYGPPATTAADNSPSPPQTIRIQIPAGTVIEVETASPISTAVVEKGAPLTFLVTRQVVVDNVLVIARGAVARARVMKSKRSRAWGRGGTLNWTMEDVVAVDGTRVPIRFSGQVRGSNRSTAVVAAAIITGAVVFPYTPPLGLVWGMQKGEDAVLYQSQRSRAIVSTNTEVAGLVPEEKKVIYHSTGLKAAKTQGASGLPAFNNRFRATPIRRRN